MKIRFPLFEAVTEGAPVGGSPVVAPVVAPVVPPAVVAPKAPAPGETPDPLWLNPRLDAAGKAATAALLAQLGVSTPEEAAAKIKAAKDAELAGKTEAEKAAQRIADLEAKAKSGEAAAVAVKAYADRELAALTEPQRAAVKSLAGDDSTKVLSAIEALRPTWSAAPVTPAAGAPPVVTPGANTSPPPTAPNGTQSTSKPDRHAEYLELKKTNPFAAAALIRTYPNEIYPASG